jgi:hypothetical protein
MVLPMSLSRHVMASGDSRRNGGEEVMPVSSPAQGYRELSHRAMDGLEVFLLWHQPSNGVLVAVSDARTGGRFELDVPPGEALGAFHHPYAYAAARGVPYDTDLIPCRPKTPGATPVGTYHGRSPERPR